MTGESLPPATHTIAGERQDPPVPGSGRLRCSGAGYPCPPQGCRGCIRRAVATTLPRVIALGSVCAVRAPGIVARDGGDRCRAARCTSARTCGDVMQAAAPLA